LQRSRIGDAFVSHFGDMAKAWGMNRAAGQIHALLYVAGEALAADEIAQSLGMSRSNVSMALKELQSWGLVSLRRRPGERRDYFMALEDARQIMAVVARERRRRELDPALAMLRALLREPAACEAAAREKARLRPVLSLMEQAARWVEAVDPSAEAERKV